MFIKNSPFQDSSAPAKPEPSLLEELGINPTHIKQKTLGVLTFRKLDNRLLKDPDMAGPLLFILLLLTGQPHFWVLYCLGLLGSTSVYGVLNLISQSRGISLYQTVSILGYSLLPILIPGLAGALIPLNVALRALLTVLCIAWSTLVASQFFATYIELKEQQWLAAYPVGLLYTCFTCALTR